MHLSVLWSWFSSLRVGLPKADSERRVELYVFNESLVSNVWGFHTWFGWMCRLVLSRSSFSSSTVLKRRWRGVFWVATRYVFYCASVISSNSEWYANQRKSVRLFQGRVDDNIETIRKRFKVFVESSVPVVEYYNSCGKVHKVSKLMLIKVAWIFVD